MLVTPFWPVDWLAVLLVFVAYHPVHEPYPHSTLYLAVYMITVITVIMDKAL